jgi:hypothetical protein
MKEYGQTAISNLPILKDSYVYSIGTTAAQDDVQYDTFQSISQSDRLVVISSDDSLLILDPETLNTVPNGKISGANKSITCLKRFAATGQQCNVFLTAGRDGAVRGWDLRSSKAVLKFQCPQGPRETVPAPISALDSNFESHSIAAGTELEGEAPGDVAIHIWDSRNPQKTRTTFSESHTDTITELRFLPYPSQSPITLLSGSTDGLVTVFDTTVSEEDDAVLQVINHRSAVHHTGLLGKDIYALGTDEKLSFYTQQDPNPDLKDPDPFVLGDLREHAAGCEYAIKIRNDQSRPLLAVGAHTEAQNLSFIKLQRAPIIESPVPQWIPDDKQYIRLNGGHGEEIVRDFFIADRSRVIFTCGEDGLVKQWKEQSPEDVEMGGMQSSKRKKNYGQKKAGKRRKADTSDQEE